MKIWILLFLIMAAIYDYRDFKIPNKLNGAGALITLVLARVSGMKAADMMIGVLVVLISCGLLFYIGCLGGGDVKLLMVCAISIGRAMPRFLILSFICKRYLCRDLFMEEEELPSAIISLISICNTM